MISKFCRVLGGIWALYYIFYRRTDDDDKAGKAFSL